MQVIFKLVSVIDGWDISCETVVRWMSLELSDDKSALVVAWWHQAITWANVDPDLCHQMASLVLNELSIDIFHRQQQ